MAKILISLLLLSKYFVYLFMWGSFINNGAGKASVSFAFTIQNFMKQHYSFSFYFINANYSFFL